MKLQCFSNMTKDAKGKDYIFQFPQTIIFYWNLCKSRLSKTIILTANPVNHVSVWFWLCNGNIQYNLFTKTDGELLNWNQSYKIYQHF